MQLPPLADRVRPQSLAEICGQQHLVQQGTPIYNMLHQKQLSSIIFWGPPGVGKTTIANIIAHEAGLPFYKLSAVESGVKDVRQVIEKSATEGKAVLFLDEIHRFNKAQQDSLLGAVEKGIIVLIGATTENPSFEVISPLLSRSQVYVLKELSKEDLNKLLENAIAKDEILKTKKINLKEIDALLHFSGGDGRKLLNLFELVINQFDPDSYRDEVVITNKLVQNILQSRLAMYDKNGEQHYDIISAFIKSIRGSDPNAAVYYLARMIEGGEDPKFIARRMVILASEDIGNANPNALLLATNCFSAVEQIGYPECRIILSQVAIYLACSAKSNASYMAIENALQLVKTTGDLSVPLTIRNAPTKLMKELNYGKDYKYAHQFENNFIDIEFLPKEIVGTKLYNPNKNASEEILREHLRNLWKEKYGY